MKYKICNQCQYKLPIDAKYCRICGVEQKDQKSTPVRMNKVIYVNNTYVNEEKKLPEKIDKDKKYSDFRAEGLINKSELVKSNEDGEVVEIKAASSSDLAVNKSKENNLKSIILALLVIILIGGLYFWRQGAQLQANAILSSESTQPPVAVTSAKIDTEPSKVDNSKTEVMEFEGSIAMNSGWGAVMNRDSVTGDLLLGIFDANAKIGEEVLATCSINKFCKISAEVKCGVVEQIIGRKCSPLPT